MAKGPERVEEMVRALRQWQGIERKSMEQTAQILEGTSNPFVRILIEIIRHDSLMHHRVQQALIDSLTVADVPLTNEELGKIWEQIEAHDATEKETVNLAKTLRDQSWSPTHKALLNYLLTDEEKHDSLLEQLGEIKRGLTRATQ
jgi:rubrerythrin